MPYRFQRRSSRLTRTRCSGSSITHLRAYVVLPLLGRPLVITSVVSVVRLNINNLLIKILGLFAKENWPLTFQDSRDNSVPSNTNPLIDWAVLRQRHSLRVLGIELPVK